MEVLNLLTMSQFLQNSSKFLQQSSIIYPKILINQPKIKISISLHVSRNSIRSEPCSLGRSELEGIGGGTDPTQCKMWLNRLSCPRPKWLPLWITGRSGGAQSPSVWAAAGRSWPPAAPRRLPSAWRRSQRTTTSLGRGDPESASQLHSEVTTCQSTRGQWPYGSCSQNGSWICEIGIGPTLVHGTVVFRKVISNSTQPLLCERTDKSSSPPPPAKLEHDPLSCAARN